MTHVQSPPTKPLLGVAALTLLLAQKAPAQGQNGFLFDPGRHMHKPASGAPEELAQLERIWGSWNVEVSTPIRGTRELRSQTGFARFTWMNRGHAMMEQLYLEAGEDTADVHLMAFHAFAPASSTWGTGEASSDTMAVQVFHGGFEDGSQVLHRAITVSGGLGTTLQRRTLSFQEDGSFVVLLESSTDLGASYLVDHRRHYTPRSREAFAPLKGISFGASAPSAFPQARQFDFLIGTFDAKHWMKFADGRELQWMVDATAVHTLGGHALLEFSSFDTDPNLPDAATSILRIFNPAQRRWESLYLTNRGNALLHFGGKQEGDSMVLHAFDVDATAPNYSQWIFFNATTDSYQWKALNSSDGGANFNTTWTIDFQRKATTKQRNHQVWEEQGARLRMEAKGQWVAIADGAVLGHWDSFDDALAVLQFAQDDRSHAYLYRAGIDDMPLQFSLSPFLSTDPHWSQIGRSLAGKWGLTMAAAGNIWERDGKVAAWGDDNDAQAVFSNTVTGKTYQEGIVVSAMLQGDITLRPAIAEDLKLGEFECPVPATPWGKDEILCRRIPVRVQFPSLEIDSVGMAIILPDYADEAPHKAEMELLMQGWQNEKQN